MPPFHDNKQYADWLNYLAQGQGQGGPAMNALSGGQRGTQSGPTQESDPMFWERLLQGAAGYGMAGGSGLAFGAGQPEIGGPMLAGGMAARVNSSAPNPQDVWTHQAMQQLRRGYRGR
jgi:hypothetical protein